MQERDAFEVVVLSCLESCLLFMVMGGAYFARTSGCQNEMVEGLHIEYYVEKLLLLLLLPTL